MKKNAVVIAVTLIICLACAIVFVAGGICQYGETKAKEAASTVAPVKVNNAICPVTGNPVNMNNPVTVEYNGKIYNLCCSMCPATFRSNPEKYSKIADEQAKSASK